jgi:drug/metabolite transporter (DMT)-like permease
MPLPRCGICYSLSLSPMTRLQLTILTVLALLAFASNSLLCRLALQHAGIDAASFTTLRLISGALTLWMIVRARQGTRAVGGSWLSAFALFAYAAGFSFAYTQLSAATGALLLFGAVQATMIGNGLLAGERFSKLQLTGLMLAVAGLMSLLSPGISRPPLLGSLQMLSAGAAWGIYSLRGRREGDPTETTAGNFQRAVPMAIVLSALTLDRASVDSAGFWSAVASGSLASAIGYAIWYTALPALKATHAATVQLSVPVIAALGGIFILGESLTLRLCVASVAVLGGIALVIVEK